MNWEIFDVSNRMNGIENNIIGFCPATDCNQFFKSLADEITSMFFSVPSEGFPISDDKKKLIVDAPNM